MTIRDIIIQNKDKWDDFEICQYTDNSRKLHSDHIRNINEHYPIDFIKDLHAYDYYLMDEDEYNNTILADCSSANFDNLYGNKDAKILVVMLDYDIDIDYICDFKKHNKDMNVEFDWTPSCTECGQKYPILDGDDGLPVMVGFVTKEGVINVCKYCLINIGMQSLVGGNDNEVNEHKGH